MANPVLKRIRQIGRQVGASPMEIKSAVETGIVESNLSNPSGGDADSAGWRQERRSIYKDPTNLDASIRRYFSETKAQRGKHSNAGSLAAAVQRPAAQYRGRYQQVSGQADALLGGASAPVVGRSAYTGATSRQVNAGPPVTPDGFNRGDILKQYLATRGRPGSTMALAGGLGALKQPTRTVTTPGSPLPTSSAVSGAGEFRITGANPGRLRKPLVSFAEKVAGVYGKPLTGDSGATHAKMTVDGNVSDHFTGNATDIPATGKQLIAMGQAALIAAGMSPAQARKQTGGLFNVGGHQVIFNTHLGGDHTNHLHISAG